MAVLGCEMAWRQQRSHVARTQIDYAAVRRTGLPVSLVLRVGPYQGTFAPDAPSTIVLSNLAVSLVVEAKSAGVPLKEIQIDFDSAESKLDGYRVWVESIRQRIAPVSLTITALPCWLRHDSFVRLARAAGGYVLQVHSLERPASADAPMTLCDPIAARRAVEQAASVGVPFRVALPTYGYVAGFDSQNKLLGLSAEGPLLSWPMQTRLREVRADATELAGLVREWTDKIPAHLTGIIWYRLPTAGDTLNWRWPTLAAVMRGKIPQPALRVEVRRPKPGLAEFELSNTGDADAVLPVIASTDCEGASVESADALNGFEVVRESNTLVRFRGPLSATSHRLAPGEHKLIGWLRVKTEKEIKVYVVPLEN